MAEESTLTEEEQIVIRRQLEAVLGDDYDPEGGIRSQVREALEAAQIRNAATLAAQSTDMILIDFMRLLYLNNQFADPASAPSAIQYEMMDLQSSLPIETAEPAAAPYSGPTYDITSGPEAVTGQDLAAAYVERRGGHLEDGPLDHSDTVITKADLQDAIERYESIEITDEQIAAYRADTMQQLVDSRMNGIDPADPEYATQLENAQEWATEMGLPSESVIISALRHETFLEQNPEMRLSEEQAQSLASSYGVADPNMVMQNGSVLAYYTDSPESRSNGMYNYMHERADILSELETTRAAEYEASISNQVAEVASAVENAAALSYTIAGDSRTGIDREAFDAKNTEMAAALESGDYNTALNIGNELTQTILADADTRQLNILTDNFDELQASAASAGYTVDSPEDLQALLNGENGAQVQSDMEGQRFVAGTDALNVFNSSEYTATENIRRDGLATLSEIEVAAAKFEGVELAEVDTSALTTRGAIAAEAAAAPPLDLADAARRLIDEYRGENGARIGPIVQTATGERIDIERLSLTREIIPEFNAGITFDIDNPEDLASALVALETYESGEMPSAERLQEIENVVDAAFNSDDAITFDAANASATISAAFQAAVASAPSGGFMGAFRNVVEVGIPDGYDARVANVPTPEERAPAAAVPGLG